MQQYIRGASGFDTDVRGAKYHAMVGHLILYNTACSFLLVLYEKFSARHQPNPHPHIYQEVRPRATVSRLVVDLLYRTIMFDVHAVVQLTCIIVMQGICASFLFSSNNLRTVC